MIEMIVGGLGFDPRNLSPLVLLRDQDELNFLPIWIGVFEAAAVAMELQGVKPPRPMTHDLLQSTIEALGGKIKHVAIFVSEMVMMQAKLVNSEKDAEETKKFNDFVQNIRPEDFTKYYNKDKL